MKGKVKLAVLYLFSFLSCSLPLIAVFIARSDRYISSLSDAVRLSVGGVVCLFFLFLKAIGKLHMPRRIVLYAFLLVMVYLMEPVIFDLKVLCLAALAGELLDYMIFQNLIRRERERQLIGRTAQATTEATRAAVDDLLKTYMGGRV